MSERGKRVGNVKFDLRGDRESALEHMRRRDPQAGFVHLLHPDQAAPTDTLTRIAWKDSEAKEFLVELTNMGYLNYLSKDGESRLVHESRLPDLWGELRDGEFQQSASGQIYQYSPPRSGEPARKLLVIFSSVVGSAFSSSLSRYFTRTFLTVQKYLPRDVGVLRLADVGGTVGEFYMNTRAHPGTMTRVGEFIRWFADENDIARDDIVLYGASKGGTAALAYGLMLDLKFVSVDPLVDDTYYQVNYNDLHFTGTNIFLETKTAMYERILSGFLHRRGGAPLSTMVSRAVICSPGSPLYPYIEEQMIAPLREHVSFYRSNNPEITSHPGVGEHTINVLTMLLNAYLYRLETGTGVVDVS